MTEKRWTVCMDACGKLKKFCQYKDKERAEKHAADIGGVVILAPINPERVVEYGGRKSASYRKVGLPQY